VLFATDYPHWDFDDPAQAFPMQMTETQKRALFLDNAKAVFGVD
jgi:predicted TIM-barrel fold metal-dependent hydrolase